jgi:hypothetical protein
MQVTTVAGLASLLTSLRDMGVKRARSQESEERPASGQELSPRPGAQIDNLPHRVQERTGQESLRGARGVAR